MKKLYLLSLAVSMAFGVVAQNKFDARSEIIASEYLQALNDPSKMLLPAEELPFETLLGSRAQATASAAVVFVGGVDQDELNRLGLEVVAATRSVAVVHGPVGAIVDLAESDLVKAVSFADTCEQHLDYARKFTGVEVIHQGGDGLPQAYTGKGVITGIFDNGFHPDHINFKDSDGVCRITNFWHYTKNDGSGLVHYNGPDQVVKISNQTDNANSSHGTHTMGCMAGYCYPNVKQLCNYDQREDKTTKVSAFSKDGLPMPFYGMATESEIVASAGALTTTNMMAGIKKMADYIVESGKPGVINLSIGTIVGPKDGSDAFGLFLDEIAENVTVCVSAGNEGDSNATLTGESFGTFVVPSTPGAGAIAGAIDIWGSDSKDFDASFVVFNVKENKIEYELKLADKQTILANKSYSNATATNAKFEEAFKSSYITANAKALSVNNRFNLYLNYSLTFNPTQNSDGNLVFGIKLKAAEGSHVDLVHKPSKGDAILSGQGVVGWSNGTSDISINSMACGKNVIAVGAWNTRNIWGLIPNNRAYYSNNPAAIGLGLDDVAGYSSYGQLCDGRKKPDFTAPGTAVISSVSTPGVASLETLTSPCASYTYAGTTRVDSWGCMQGTSMASPVAAGAIALWLEAEPSLSTADIRRIAIETASADEFTATGNPLRWGAGKLNALAGIKAALNQAGITDVSVDAGSKISVVPEGLNLWQVYLPGANKLNVTVVDLSGHTVKTVVEAGENAQIDLNSLAKGVYVLNANGAHSVKLAVK